MRVMTAVVLGAAAQALGCPLCDTGTGEEVRAGIFDGEFGVNLLATVLPFVVFAGVAAVVHVGWPRRGAGR